jgi:hypothetical protein
MGTYETEGFECVIVDDAWLSRAKAYGTQRESLNGGNDTAAYRHNGSLPYSSLTAQRLAVVGEVAAHFYFKVDPEATTFVVDRTAADYEALRANADLTVGGRKIEVRNSTNPARPLPIKQKDVAAKALVVQVHVQMQDRKPTGRVYLLGWADAVEDYKKCSNVRNGTAYKAYKRPMADLAPLLGVPA